jgi:hypothetical protein
LLSLNPSQGHLYLWVSGSQLFNLFGIKAKTVNKDCVTSCEAIKMKDEDSKSVQAQNRERGELG